MSDEEACFKIERWSVIKFLVAEGCKLWKCIGECQLCVYGATCFIKNKDKEQRQEQT